MTTPSARAVLMDSSLHWARFVQEREEERKRGREE
jgi:hypothetical protein